MFTVICGVTLVAAVKNLELNSYLGSMELYWWFVWPNFDVLCGSVWKFWLCLLAWSRPFEMAENSIVDSGVKGMSCSTPVNPFKPTDLFTPASDSSMNYFGSPSRRFHSGNPFAPKSNTDHNSADLFIQCRKFNKPVKNPADYDGSQSLWDYLRHWALLSC